MMIRSGLRYACGHPHYTTEANKGLFWKGRTPCWAEMVVCRACLEDPAILVGLRVTVEKVRRWWRAR